MIAIEKRFEIDTKETFLSSAGGYVKGTDQYDAKAMLYADTLSDFVRQSQPKA